MGEWGDRASPLAVFYLSVHPWRLLDCLVQQRGGRGDRERALRPSTDKAKAERTSLQVNSEKQLAGSRGKLGFQTINHHSLLHNNKDVAYSTAFTSRSISYFVLKLLCRPINSKSFG